LSEGITVSFSHVSLAPDDKLLANLTLSPCSAEEPPRTLVVLRSIMTTLSREQLRRHEDMMTFLLDVKNDKEVIDSLLEVTPMAEVATTATVTADRSMLLVDNGTDTAMSYEL
jgi:hypothetical protein